ncbi:MAG: hypothetical protein AB8B83_06775 [Bdellovibrionales bacterium]
MVAQSELLTRWKSASYRPEREWKSTEHPLAGAGASISDYTEIAHRSVADLERQLTEFFDEHGFSYVQIHHSEFRESYEPTSTNFRSWFRQQCANYNLNPNADLLLIGPSVKDIASSERKMLTEKHDPDAIRDYLRAMVVVLKTKSTPKAKFRNDQSFSVFERLMTAIEMGEDAIPYKNQLWHPHRDTAFRGFKARWTATDSEDSDYQLLSEVKFQHETQMDIDKLTRSFLTMTRSRLRLQHDFPKMNPGRGYIASGNAEKQAQFIRHLGILLYNRVHADAGFNQRFLDPEYKDDYGPHDFYAIDGFIDEHLGLFMPIQQKQIARKLAVSGIFPRSSDFHEAPDAPSI